jgi:sortase family protein
LEPPSDVHRTCRWAGGADLGAAQGTTVITGHINWVGQGTGALGNIGRLAPGNAVYTADGQGTVTRWQVQRVTFRNKNRGVDLRAFDGPGGPRVLYLISCGGPFDAADASYVDNIYVRAVPAPWGTADG